MTLCKTRYFFKRVNHTQGNKVTKAERVTECGMIINQKHYWCARKKKRKCSKLKLHLNLWRLKLDEKYVTGREFQSRKWVKLTRKDWGTPGCQYILIFFLAEFKTVAANTYKRSFWKSCYICDGYKISSYLQIYCCYIQIDENIILWDGMFSTTAAWRDENNVRQTFYSQHQW